MTMKFINPGNMGGFISGDMTITGDLNVEGDLNFGDAATDTLTVDGLLTFGATNGQCHFPDSILCSFGNIATASDSQISSNGTHSVWNVDSGDLVFQNDGGSLSVSLDSAAASVLQLEWRELGVDNFLITVNSSRDETLIVGNTGGGNQVNFTEYGNRGRDHDHDAETDFAVHVHSAKSTDTDNQQFGKFQFITDGGFEITSGTDKNISVNPGGTGIITANSDFEILEPVNDGNPVFKIGAATGDDYFQIQARYDSGAQTIDDILIEVATSNATANKGSIKFYIDGATTTIISDDGVNFPDARSSSYGTNYDWRLEYDEATTDSLHLVEGVVPALAFKGSAITGFSALTNVDGNDLYLATQSALDNDKDGGNLHISIGAGHGTGDAGNFYVEKSDGTDVFTVDGNAASPTVYIGTEKLTDEGDQIHWQASGSSAGSFRVGGSIGVGAINAPSPNGTLGIHQTAATSGTPYTFSVIGGAHTGITTTAESPGVILNLSATKTWATGAITEQSEIKISAPTYAAAAGSVMTTGSTFTIDAAPTAGANMTITTPLSLWVKAGAARLDGNLEVRGANFRGRTAVGAGDYNPSALTDDYIIAVDNTAAARAVTISTEDEDSGTTTNPRIFIIKDESGGAAAQNITVTLESGGTIDGAANFVMNVNYQSITLYVDATNAHVI